MSTIEKIRQEIERLKKTDGVCQNNNETADVYYARGARLVCEVLLSFLDTLQHDKEYKLKGYIVRQPETATVCFSETVPLLTGDNVWINGDGWSRKLERLPIKELFDVPRFVEITIKVLE